MITHRTFLSLLFFSLLIWTGFRSADAQSLPPVNIKYASVLNANNGAFMGYLGEKRRVEVKGLWQVSRHVVDALIATEDREFFEHSGVSLRGIGRAIIRTLGGHKEGGSTLTMQLARNLFLSPEQTISRKIDEIGLARELEKKYNKEQILLMYLNTVYFGRGVFGIWAAAHEYFGKLPDQLDIPESALIIAQLKGPSNYDPEKNPQRALDRRNEVMYNLVETGKLSKTEYQKLRKRPLGVHLRKVIGRAYIEYARKEAAEIVKGLGKNINTDQLIITTTADLSIQSAAEQAVAKQFSLFPASMKNAQVALVTIEPWTGKVVAMIGGGPSSNPTGWNRASQSRRQPGSAFKPFLYASLLERGMTLATPLLDAPLVVNAGKPNEWKPSNDEGRYSGRPVPMAWAIQNSLNLAAAYAMVNLTRPDSVAAFAHRCGIVSTLPAVPSLALGTGEVSPLELAGAIAVFPAQGMRAKPFCIWRIEDKDHHLIYEYKPDTAQVLDRETCFLTTTALQAVVDSGTAAVIRSFYKGAAAGKTGTTQNSADAWFAGYTPSLATVVWAGYDNPSQRLQGTYRYGGTVCAPIWGRMMALAAKARPDMLHQAFVPPDGIIWKELCLDSGELAGPRCPRHRNYPVNSNKMPPACLKHR
jgi:penicillin-binding protein 1A